MTRGPRLGEGCGGIEQPANVARLPWPGGRCARGPRQCARDGGVCRRAHRSGPAFLALYIVPRARVRFGILYLHDRILRDPRHSIKQSRAKLSGSEVRIMRAGRRSSSTTARSTRAQSAERHTCAERYTCASVRRRRWTRARLRPAKYPSSDLLAGPGS